MVLRRVSHRIMPMSLTQYLQLAGTTGTVAYSERLASEALHHTLYLMGQYRKWANTLDPSKVLFVHKF